MGTTTRIAWCDSTFNPWLGCIRVSPACDHCYAAALSWRTGRRDHHGLDLSNSLLSARQNRNLRFEVLAWRMF